MTTRRKTLLGAALCLLGLSLPAGAHARTTPGDYDGDGRTDIAIVRAVGGTLTWFIRFATGVESTPIAFGLAGTGTADAIQAGDFDGNSTFEPNVVRTRADGFLEWISMAPDGSPRPGVLWGLRGDTPLTGFYDEDGTQDRVAVRYVGGVLNWFIKSSSGPQYLNLVWGFQGNTPFTGDLNGDGRDELIVTGTEGGFRSWYARDITGLPFNRIIHGTSTDSALAPQDVDGDNVVDFIVTRNVGGFLVAFVRLNNPDGTSHGEYSVPLGLNGDKVFVGTFFNGQAARVAAFRNSSPFTTTYVDVDQNPANSIAVSFGLRNDGVINAQGQMLGDLSGQLATVCPTVRAAGGGVLYKASSDDSGPPRQGRPALLFKTAKPASACIFVYASNGALISTFGRFEQGGSYGDRFYSGFGCGGRLNGGELAAAAVAASGSPLIAIQANPGTCIGLFDPRNRNGSL